MSKPKNYKEALKVKKEIQYREFLKERTGRCPLCEGECSDEVEGYVRNEIIKVERDPTYVPKIYGKDKKIGEE